MSTRNNIIFCLYFKKKSKNIKIKHEIKFLILNICTTIIRPSDGYKNVKYFLVIYNL